MIDRLIGHIQIGITHRWAYLIEAALRTGVNAEGEMLEPGLRVVGRMP